MHCKAEYLAELIPVDYAINGIIVCTWKVATMIERAKEMPVYNLTQGKTNVISWGKILEIGRGIAYQYPFSMMLWYPDGNIRSSKFVHNLYAIFCHWLPAYLIDGLLFIFGQKRFMIRVQTKIATGLEVLQYFTTRQWHFKNDKLLALREELKGADKEMFAMPFEEVKIEPYMKDCILGARHYLMKEDPASLPRARRTLKMMWLLDRTVTLLFYLFIAWMIVSSSETLRGILDSILDTFSSAPIFRRAVEKTDSRL
uniref:Fatty acyl-CoA reductase C-terminal domain-containing protein n=2 Tax=Homalodisca liturata TaxID=320908 RepID=A0A1B6IPD6_9HEMI